MEIFCLYADLCYVRKNTFKKTNNLTNNNNSKRTGSFVFKNKGKYPYRSHTHTHMHTMSVPFYYIL